MKQKIIGRILLSGLILMLLLSLATVVVAPVQGVSNQTTISEVYIPSETNESSVESTVIVLENVEVKRVEPTTYEESIKLYNTTCTQVEAAQQAYDGLVALGYAENHPAVIMLQTDLDNLISCKEYYFTQSEMYKWQMKSNEYPIATKIWLYMKNNFHWSDEVCAGVMGNIMAEIGGGTLKFEDDWNHPKPYGLFQWLGGRRKLIHELYGAEPTVEEQLEFMYDELYGTDGVKRQVSDAQREKILNSSSAAKAAQRFCDWFERPGGKGTIRQSYAKRAYKYFTS